MFRIRKIANPYLEFCFLDFLAVSHGKSSSGIDCAIAAHYLATFEKAAMHGHPSFAYHYFSGFREETGYGKGKGFTINYPMGEKIDPDDYQVTLKKVLGKIKAFSTEFLVVALGLNTEKGDPTGTWRLAQKHFWLNGGLIGRLKLPALIIQEGGYRHQALGSNAKAFFTGFFQGQRGPYSRPYVY